MALSPKLEIRQGQSLIMTPQLMQAIKLLQMSSLELTSFVDLELERNPLLERADGEGAASGGDAQADEPPTPSVPSSDGEDEWIRSELSDSAQDIAGRLDTDLGNIYPDEPGTRAGSEAGSTASVDAPQRDLWQSGLGARGSGAGGGDDYNLEAFVASDITLQQHLAEQMALIVSDPGDRLIARSLIDSLDELGYLRGDLDELAERFGIDRARLDELLAKLQRLEPAGVFATSLPDCLRLQLLERNRYDPAMAALIENLELLARHDYAALKTVCGVDEEDLADMIGELRALDPKPGTSFGASMIQPVVPDVIVQRARDGGWAIELNSETLPRVLVNQSYYTTVNAQTRSPKDKEFLSECLQTANWLAKSLDQRARTILKVSSEIIRQQDAFLTHGVEHLRPLNLRTVADAISMHESTVSRVTSNKFMATPRGIFELKYFFSASIPAAGGGEAHSAEAVRHRIKALIDAEAPDAILSDDTIVKVLKEDGVDIARRTVAKYRESLRIPSSVQRRREKRARIG